MLSMMKFYLAGRLSMHWQASLSESEDPDTDLVPLPFAKWMVDMFQDSSRKGGSQLTRDKAEHLFRKAVDHQK